MVLNDKDGKKILTLWIIVGIIVILNAVVMLTVIVKQHDKIDALAGQLANQVDSPKECVLTVNTTIGQGRFVYGNWSFPSDDTPSLLINLTGCVPLNVTFIEYVQKVVWSGQR